MRRSSGSSAEFTSSLSFGEIKERLQCGSRAEVPDVVVSLISASDEEQSARKRLTYSENRFEKTRTKNKYKLRARIQGVERFNPWTKTPGQIAREKNKRAKQSLKELEDDATTTLKDFNLKLDEMLEVEDAADDREDKFVGGICGSGEMQPEASGGRIAVNDRDSVADQEEVDGMFIDLKEPRVGRKAKSKLRSIMKRKASQKKKKKKENFEEMLYHINEDLRAMPSAATPGDGKVRKRGRPRKYDSQGRRLIKPRIERESVAANGSPLQQATAAVTGKNPFAIASDDPKWRRREDFVLPFRTLSTLPRAIIAQLKQQTIDLEEQEQDIAPGESSKSQPLKRKRVEVETQHVSDSDSSASGDIITVGDRLCGGSKEFEVKLKEELGRPFSVAELEEKCADVNRQKPVVRSRDLRGQRSVEFSTHKEGLSYIDHHPSLAKALKSAASSEEKLKLLRGFFFWIEHACMEGSFQPWVKQTFKFQEDENNVIILDD